MSSFSYAEAGVIGALQGATELFPVSSLGHSVLVPALIGGRWAADLDVSAPESPYLAFIVAVHVATAAALIVAFRDDWRRIITGLAVSVRDRRVTTADGRLAWLIILGTVPVGIVGLLLEHPLRTHLGRPLPAAVFLTVNGMIMLLGERLRRRSTTRGAPGPAGYRDEHTMPIPRSAPVTGRRVGTRPASGPLVAHGSAPGSGPGNHSKAVTTETALPEAEDVTLPEAETALPEAETAARHADRRLAALPRLDALLVGVAQTAALAPGISRSGVTMIAGLSRGLSHLDAARFAFLLATPVILAAGLLKLPDLLGPLGDGVRGQTLFGAIVAGVVAYVSIRFLARWFETRTATPFAVYCLVAGALCVVRFGIF
ncbi:undecaprenyl-diphosphate phosphatase [Frankia casuarinae]|uniref:Undecaprenyl-diphosphatase 1 n=2 Tax=Frankia casuarinae (strain DSM 45818 / CECT 9043 / HFP020203 / CcI3) TaxID=106370 RepID=UPPP1_FRACC|nr:undecaprenyl-diphosphate phosphatase [Frankia casuarinae]Q2JAC3.1 RecName: Full=Undecaprenyl-diphosphatase 1; AltName: Full=Bacitracin resistance protein 1; AltName: Full=Undecaprenyl pyrophosphate phosphatase 1 [Frankia casuarinae]ABD11769.1 Undecaprenyl-diphosphatase [Frankia casuarinae]